MTAILPDFADLASRIFAYAALAAGWCDVANSCHAGTWNAAFLAMDFMPLNRVAELRKSRGMTLEQLAELVELDPSYVQRIEKGTRNLSTKHIGKFAKALGVGPQEIIAGESSANAANDDNPRVAKIDALAGNATVAGAVERFALIRVRGRAMQGKEGELVFSAAGDDTIEVIEGPGRLSSVPDAYAVYLAGDSMLPLEPGWVAFVHPHQPYRRGDYVVVQLSTDNDATRAALVKKFVSMDDKTLKVEQLNPAKVLTYPRKHVVSVHRIIMFGPRS